MTTTTSGSDSIFCSGTPPVCGLLFGFVAIRTRLRPLILKSFGEYCITSTLIGLPSRQTLYAARSSCNQKQLVRKFSRMEYQQKCLLSLHRASTAVSKHASKPSAGHAPPVAPDCFRLTLERLGMLRHDQGIRVPTLVDVFPEGDFLFYPGFGKLLWHFVQAQEWLPDPSGFSLAGFYVLFIQATGWYVPQNASSFPPRDLPVHLRAKPGVKVWSHESEMPSLRLSRDIFAKQLRTFRHAVQMLFSLMKVPWQISQSQAPKAVDYPCAVASLLYRTRSSCCGCALRRLLPSTTGMPFKRLLTTKLVITRSESPVAGFPVPRYVELFWKRYRALHQTGA